MRIELSDVNQEEDVENDYLLKKVKKAALNCAAFLFQIVSRPTIPLHKKRTYEKRR